MVNTIKKILRKIVPVSVLRILYKLTKKEMFREILFARITGNDKEFERLCSKLKEKRIIAITTAQNPYNSFNMCFVSEIVGAAICAVGLGGYPFLK